MIDLILDLIGLSFKGIKKKRSRRKPRHFVYSLQPLSFLKDKGLYSIVKLQILEMYSPRCLLFDYCIHLPLHFPNRPHHK